MTTATKKNTNSSAKNRIASVISLPQIELVNLQVKLVGDSSLVTHAWAEKSKQKMRDKQGKVAQTGKEIRVPAQDFVGSLYWLTDVPVLSKHPNKAMEEALEAVKIGRFGVKANAFKNCAVSACRFADGMKMTEARGAFHVNGEFVEIDAAPPIFREDMVRVGMGSADLRYRGEFVQWSVILDITLNKHAISEAQVINLLNLGGFGVGVCEWRPEKNGSWGRFHVATAAE